MSNRRTKWDRVEKIAVPEVKPKTRGLSFEEKVARVEEVMAKYPHATRQKITQWTGYKTALLDEMYDRGVNIPKKKPTTSKNTNWMRHLNLPGNKSD